MTDACERYYIGLELLAIESSPFGVLDPERDVPFAVLTETTMELHHLTERYRRAGNDQ